MKKIAALFVVVGLMVVLSYYGAPRVVRIRRIDCRSQYGPCREEIRGEIEKVRGWELKSARAELKKVIDKYGMISEGRVDFKFPDKLEMKVLEKKAEVAVFDVDSGRYGLYDRMGDMLGETGETQLPVVTIDDEVLEGSDRRFIFSMVYEMYRWYNVRQIKIDKDGMRTRIRDLRVIIPTSGDEDVLLGSLELVLSWLNSRGTEAKIENIGGSIEVDFRYNNPVIRS